jgi:predicted cobalt transporter CbtA
MLSSTFLLFFSHHLWLQLIGPKRMAQPKVGVPEPDRFKMAMPPTPTPAPAAKQ